MRWQISKQIDFGFYFYRMVHVALNIFVWSYFNFLLLRTSDDLYSAVPLLFQRYGITYLGLVIGYVIAGYMIGKKGYKWMYKISYVISALATFLVFLNIDRITDIYLIVALIIGISSGFYWLTSNTYSLREQHGLHRGRALSLLFSMQYMFEIFLPFLAGFIITQLNYQVVFIIGTLFSLLVAFVPMNWNKVPQNHISWDEVSNILSRFGCKRMSMVFFVGQIFHNQRSMIFAFLPFLLLGNELDAGIFMSLVGVGAAFISFLHRNEKSDKKIKEGYWGASIVAVVTAMLSIVWTVPALFIRNIVAKIGFSLWSPIHMDLQNQVQEMFLSDYLQESAVEMSMFREIILFSARMVNLAFFITMFYVVKVDVTTLLRVLILISIVREFIYLIGFQWLENLFQMDMPESSKAVY